MAQCFPSHPVESSPLAEKKVFDALSRLPDPWMIFHSVGWQSYRGGRQADGEADFVALHPDYGIVLIEVKGGEITIENGQWFSRNSRTGVKHRIKDPFKQATDAKYALIRYLDDLRPPVRGAFICHAVALPRAGSLTAALTPAAPREIILDGVDLMQPTESMTRVLKHWSAKSKLSIAQIEQVKNLLAPTTTIRRTLRNSIGESTQQLLELTDAQIRALAQFRRNRRALVYGGAGTGKTVLAVERAKSLAAEGFRTLLTCYNRPLGDYLIDQVKEHEGILAGSFHSLVAREAKRAGLPIPENPDDSWWSDNAPETLVQAVNVNASMVDAIVVDEGQDFQSAWFDALLMLLKDPDEGPFYVFVDTQQAIYTSGWKPPGDWAPYDLDINCRNTLPIAKRVANVFGVEPHSLGAPGLDPVFVIADSDDEALDVVRAFSRKFFKEEMLDASQVAVISPSRVFVDALREVKVGGKKYVSLGKHGSVAETLYRFKGLEADVVFADLRSVDLLTEHGKGLAYVAMSRARAVLIVLGSMTQAKALKWPKESVKRLETEPI